MNSGPPLALTVVTQRTKPTRHTALCWSWDFNLGRLVNTRHPLRGQCLITCPLRTTLTPAQCPRYPLDHLPPKPHPTPPGAPLPMPHPHAEQHRTCPSGCPCAAAGRPSGCQLPGPQTQPDGGSSGDHSSGPGSGTYGSSPENCRSGKLRERGRSQSARSTPGCLHSAPPTHLQWVGERSGDCGILTHALWSTPPQTPAPPVLMPESRKRGITGPA